MRFVLPALAALAFAVPAWAGEPFVLLPGHIELEIGPDGNTVILDAPEGLIVVDTGRHAVHSQAILDHAEHAGKPVAAIVNTHWHLDHTTGNVDLLAAYPGARIVASDAAAGALAGFLAQAPDNARKRIADPALSPEEHGRAERTLAITTLPGMLVASDPIAESGPLVIAGRSVEVRLAPTAVTEADLWLLVPDERLAIVGDLVVAQSPFFDTGCEEGWEAALDAIGAAEWVTLIPGHGAPMDRAGFARWHTAFGNFVACAQSEANGQDCAAGWERDAAGFFTEAEAPSVRELSLYYIELLRSPPEQRMAYCRLPPA
jgi:glyoxylase-like metal-dependent hydrolase (beta-lactamase superfamily II)